MRDNRRIGELGVSTEAPLSLRDRRCSLRWLRYDVCRCGVGGRERGWMGKILRFGWKMFDFAVG